MTEATVGNIVQKTVRTTGQARSALEARQPIGRLITPGEVADAIRFCVASGPSPGRRSTSTGHCSYP